MVWTLCVCVRGHCAYDMQTLHGHWPEMTLYRVDECVVYALTDMVRYHPGWVAPLMFASSLLKGMINHCPFLSIGFLINSSSLPLTYTATIHSTITSTHKTEMHRGKSEKCLWCISTSLHCPFLSIGFLINSSSLPLTYTATIHSTTTSTHRLKKCIVGNLKSVFDAYPLLYIVLSYP